MNNYCIIDTTRSIKMNESVCYIPFNAMLGYLGTATSEGMKRSIKNRL